MKRSYLFALDSDQRLIDGPWGYDEERGAAAFERYRQRAEASGLRAFILPADTLDSLIAANPEIFAEREGFQGLRGPAALSKVDRRAKMFTPFGLAPSAPMTDEDVLVLVQQETRDLKLSAAAPAAVRDQFRALCELHTYAAFAYDFNAMVITLAAIAHEFVLGAKFVEIHKGRVELVRKGTDQRVTLEITLFGQLAEALDRSGAYPSQHGWRLAAYPDFRPSLGGLLRWAHRVGLFGEWFNERWRQVEWSVRSVELTRQGSEKWMPPEYEMWSADAQHEWWQSVARTRWEQDYLRSIAGLRNVVAHPTMHTISAPVDAVRSLRALAQFVNVLWPEPPKAR